MTLQELLVYFNESKTIGENKEAVDMMRHYSREAQKITMQINTVFHEPEEMVKLFSELTGKEVDPSFRLFPPFIRTLVRTSLWEKMFLSMRAVNSRIREESALVMAP